MALLRTAKDEKAVHLFLFGEKEIIEFKFIYFSEDKFIAFVCTVKRSNLCHIVGLFENTIGNFLSLILRYRIYIS